jgi:putative PIN family toxin of toxin-antitoxin system
MRIVLDTNVIVSALVFGGLPRQILELAEAGWWEFCYSEDLQAEVRRVLERKCGWEKSKLDEVLSELWMTGDLVVPRFKVKAVKEDPDDDRILECAIAANAKVLVSGDRHLLRLRKYKSILIVAPRDFLGARFGEGS